MSQSELTFVLGGARGGKSTHALRLAESGQRVLFVATAEAGDADMARRIETHRAERPVYWRTLEEPLELAEALCGSIGDADTIIIDCLTLWVSNVLLRDDDEHRAERELTDRVRALLDVIHTSPARWIIVSNEVGMGLVPPSKLGRTYRDLLGRVNQRIAERADRVVLMVAGVPFELKREEKSECLSSTELSLPHRMDRCTSTPISTSTTPNSKKR